jgi:DNA-binding transcriptional regulator YdaS (Cro superfamily)
MKLADYIKRRHANARAFARDIGVHWTTINRIMRGFPPAPATAAKIIAATEGKVGIADLYGPAVQRRHQD